MLRSRAVTILRQVCSRAFSSTLQRPSSGQTIPRFYKAAGVQPNPEQGGHEATLDGRALRSPAGRPLVVPTRQLALAIASEWEQQDARTIRPFTMPLMSLASHAIDEPKPREQVIETMLQYLHTDSACCRDEPGPLADRQAQVFDPIVRWFEQRLGVSLRVDDSIMGAEQGPEVIRAVREHLSGLSRWHLAITDAAAAACRSVVFGIALTEGRLSVADALEAARVEEDFQIEEWGLVEGGHDIDIADARARVAAPAVFVRLLEYQTDRPTAV